MTMLPDISSRGQWQVSSSKHGFGAHNLLDPNSSTFWQSDGRQPHHISVHFTNRHHIHTVSLYLDVEKDESYTPCKVCVFAGSSERDAVLVKEEELAQDPHGWVDFEVDGLVWAHYLRIELPLNYENGRDARVRMARVLGPPESEEKFRNERILPYTSVEFTMYDSFR
ncbi:hypothetical protein IW139_006110 [Coemansia sp. RSA 353]|nr:hypothetical protein LPJ58_000311 [Coemansia sp. RSA 1591]KAJ1767866.1 hypothetical protein LPJ69_000309 [Coemansia sp. RSA 1752]KAJ1795094.1 hypothetical protein LPJ67_000269 [Coemansia sp. RSA 1938]KAJ2145899.1 hypothetical protein IW142_002372 [Coemansia sp. RSA 564]KAJ2159441.1 hypothetical protein GGH16_005299 [Coemansia sp. RSA 560]KAJ2184034.1 hypothetical protein GGH18_004764 [Coemansia sp. RSA 530]KAJ2187210.1 hypothetical protein EV181_002887 [Coemansia sp. RSA 532]KAJ2197590.1 